MVIRVAVQWLTFEKGKVYDSNTVGRVGEPSDLGLGQSIRHSTSVGVARDVGDISGALGPVSRAVRAVLSASGAGSGVVTRGGGANAGSAGVSGLVASAGTAGDSPGPGTILAHFARAGTGSGDRSHECLLGAACYTTAFKLSSLGCVVALILSIIAGVRRERRAHRR